MYFIQIVIISAFLICANLMMKLDGDSNVILASASYDHTIRLWNADNGACLRTFKHSESQVNALALVPPNYHMIAAAGHDHVRLFDLNASDTNRGIDFVLNRSKNVTCLGFEKNGRLMFTGDEDKKVKIWDLNSRITSRVFDSIDGIVSSVLIHPNQRELFIGDHSGKVTVWDTRSDARLVTLVAGGSAVHSIAIDPTGLTLAALTAKGDCHVWNVAKLAADEDGAPASLERIRPRHTFSAHRRYGLKVAFSPDSTLIATTSADGTCKLWASCDYELRSALVHPSQTTGTVAATANLQQPKWVWDAAFAADSEHVVTASADGLVRAWAVNTAACRQEYSGHSYAVTCLALHDTMLPPD